METLTDVSELRPYLDKADVIDVKHFQGATTLRRFIAGMLSYYPITIVFYKHWTGPVYFNLIRPFHHLVVARMARHGLTYTGDNHCHL
jgi:hypothetical protein